MCGRVMVTVIGVIKCADVPVISDTPGSLKEGRGKRR